MRSFSFHQVKSVEATEKEHDGHKWVQLRLTYRDGNTDDLTVHNDGAAPEVLVWWEAPAAS